MAYGAEHKLEKLEYLQKAIDITQYTVHPTDQSVDDIIAVARKIEAYVYSAMETAKVDSTAEARAAFLASLDANNSCCGRGKDDCNGSEETCSCQ